MKNKKTGLIALIILLIAGGVYGFMFMGPQTPEEEVMQAQKNTSNLDSYGVDVEMDMELEGAEGAPEMSFLGGVDYDRANKAMEGEGTMDMSTEGLAVTLGAGFTYVDENLYGRVTSFPYLALPVAESDIEALTENDILLVENLPEQADLFLAGFFTELGTEPITTEELFDESERLSDKVWEDGVMKVTNTEEDEYNEKTAKKYTLEIDGEKMADFYADLIEEYQVMDLFPELSEEEKEEMMEEMDAELKNSYEDSEIFAWVQDEHLVKMEVTSTSEFNEEDFSEIDQLEETPDSMTVNMTINYTDFNEEFDISAPEEYITIEELREDLPMLQMFEPQNLEDFDPEEDLDLEENQDTEEEE
ncbi:MAG: hypothetical protein ACQEP3_02510 [Patescibacteria group bacterium]